MMNTSLFSYLTRLRGLLTVPGANLYAAGLVACLIPAYSLGDAGAAYKTVIPIYLSFAPVLLAKSALTKSAAPVADECGNSADEGGSRALYGFIAAQIANAIACAIVWLVSCLMWAGFNSANAVGLVCQSSFILSVNLLILAKTVRGGLLAGFAASAALWLSSVIIPQYSPARGFASGIADMRVIIVLVSLCCILGLAQSRKVSAGFIKQVGMLLLVAVLGAFLPANVSIIDLTSQRLTDISQTALEAYSYLDEAISVRQVARFGREDAVISGYMEKLDERHELIDYGVVLPSALPEVEFSDGDMYVESAGEIIVVRQRDISTDAGFDLEGAYLTAIDEATGLNLTYAGVPAARPPDCTTGKTILPSIIAAAALLALHIAAQIRGRRKNA